MHRSAFTSRVTGFVFKHPWNLVATEFAGVIPQIVLSELVPIAFNQQLSTARAVRTSSLDIIDIADIDVLNP